MYVVFFLLNLSVIYIYPQNLSHAEYFVVFMAPYNLVIIVLNKKLIIEYHYCIFPCYCSREMHLNLRVLSDREY